MRRKAKAFRSRPRARHQRLTRELTAPSSQTPGGHAFTLVELLLVVAVMGILFAAAVPRLGGALATVQLKETARQLERLVSHAQAQAILTRRTYRLNFDDALEHYWLTAQKNPPEGTDFQRPQACPFSVCTVPTHVTIAALQFSEPRYAAFFPDGEATPGRVLLRCADGSTAEVKVVGYYGERPVEDEADE